MIQVDDNFTQIMLALISLLGVIVTGIFSFMSLRYASAAKTQSSANAMTLNTVHEQVNGLTRSRIDAEARVGDAKVAQARAEGRLEEMARALPATLMPPETKE